MNRGAGLEVGIGSGVVVSTGASVGVEALFGVIDAVTMPTSGLGVGSLAPELHPSVNTISPKVMSHNLQARSVFRGVDSKARRGSGSFG